MDWNESSDVRGSSPSLSTNFGCDNSSAISVGSSPATTTNFDNVIEWKADLANRATISRRTEIQFIMHKELREGSIPSVVTNFLNH